MGLTDKQRADFERDGVLVVEGFADTAACKELIERSGELLEDFEPESISVFTTHEQTRTSDDYFLESGDKVRFFFEEDAFLPDGSLKQAKELSINKIGHAMHDLDPVFSAFSRSAGSGRRCCRRRVRRSEAAAVDVHLQAAEHRRRGDLPPGLARSSTPTRCRASASGSRSRTRRSRTAACGRSPAVTGARCGSSSGVRGRRHEFETLSDAPLPEPGDGRLVPVRDTGGNAGAAARSAAPLQRSEPLAEVAPRVLVARDRGLGRVSHATTGCSAVTTCRFGGSAHERSLARVPSQGAEGACCTTTSMAA